jgi:hypothetical protein
MRSAAASSVMSARPTYSRVRFVVGETVVAMRHLGVRNATTNYGRVSGGRLTTRLYAHAVDERAPDTGRPD